MDAFENGRCADQLSSELSYQCRPLFVQHGKTTAHRERETQNNWNIVDFLRRCWIWLLSVHLYMCAHKHCVAHRYTHSCVAYKRSHTETVKRIWYRNFIFPYDSNRTHKWTMARNWWLYKPFLNRTDVVDIGMNYYYSVNRQHSTIKERKKNLFFFHKKDTTNQIKQEYINGIAVYL